MKEERALSFISFLFYFFCTSILRINFPEFLASILIFFKEVSNFSKFSPVDPIGASDFPASRGGQKIGGQKIDSKLFFPTDYFTIDN